MNTMLPSGKGRGKEKASNKMLFYQTTKRFDTYLINTLEGGKDSFLVDQATPPKQKDEERGVTRERNRPSLFFMQWPTTQCRSIE